MTAYYTLLLVLHTLLLAYWLGLDLGIFYLGFSLSRRELPAFTRTTLLQILVTLDMVPRFCLILTLPVGVSLALNGGYATLSARWDLPILYCTWLLTLFWAALAGFGFRHPGRGDLPNIDRVIRLVVIAAVLSAAASSLAGSGPIDTHSGWLSTKLIVYAGIVAADMMIHAAFRPLRMEFERLRKGSIPCEMEDTIRTRLRRAKPWVWLSWAGLVLEACLGLAKLY